MENPSPLLLGIDLGTSSIKAALVTHGPNSKVEKSVSRDIGLVSGHNLSNTKLFCLPNEHTQDVGKIFQCLHILLSSIPLHLMARVTDITVTGQMHGVVGWLGHGLAFVERSKLDTKKLEVNVSGGGCGKLYTWMDRRCNKGFLESLPVPRKSEKPFSGFGWATILWFFNNVPGEFSSGPMNTEEEKEIFEKAAVLRKISVGARTQSSSLSISIDSGLATASQPKSRSISQSPLPTLSNPVQHAPWTCVGTIADFLVAGLASLERPVMSPQMAMSWGYFDTESNYWDLHALNATGFNLSHLLPDVVPCGTEVGKLAFDWEGIPAGARVYAALGDLQCSVYPFLEREFESDGVAACSISTSAQIAFKLPVSVLTNGRAHDDDSESSQTDSGDIFQRLLASKHIAVWPFFKPDERIAVAASLNGGNVIDRFVKMLRVWCRQLGCPAIETAQVYEKLSHAAAGQMSSDGSPTGLPRAFSEMRIDPRLFEERYCGTEDIDQGASVTNIQPDDIFNLPAIYASVCRGVVRNLVSMAPSELLTWANVKKLYCMGGAIKRNPLILNQLKSEYSQAEIDCILEDNVVEACVGAALFTATLF